MFERELTDAQFVKRWSIVRTLIPQSIAEHTFLVTHYANDIAIYLGLAKPLHLRLLQRCIWHDAKDEIFTSDLPGPNKRGLLDAIGPDAKGKWNAKLQTWAERVFPNLINREGGRSEPDPGAEVIELILKTADWLEAAVRMATEFQMGNQCAERHILPNMNGAIETAEKLCKLYFDEPDVGFKEIPIDHTPGSTAMYFLYDKIRACIDQAKNGQSVGPWITKEDDTRTYHDPALGDRA